MNGDTLWSMTPERMLREIFGETDLEEPPHTPPNMTPLFRLAAIMPEFADELSQLLTEQGETSLAASVIDFWVFDRCRCGSDHCVVIYTRPKPEGPYPGRGCVSLFPKTGAIYLDTSEGMIACIEVLDRPEIRRKLVGVLP
jgi:hypothetical protein